MKKAFFLLALIVIASQCFADIWEYEVSGHAGPTLIINEEGEYEIKEPVLTVILDVKGRRAVTKERPGSIPPVNPYWEIYTQFAYNHLTFEDETVKSSYIINANLDVRLGLLLGERISPFLGLGPGYYRLGTTNSNEFGINGMAGVGFHLMPHFTLELGANMHYLFDEANTSFLQTTAGAAYQFGG